MCRNEPPRVSVADVAITVTSPNSPAGEVVADRQRRHPQHPVAGDVDGAPAARGAQLRRRPLPARTAPASPVRGGPASSSSAPSPLTSAAAVPVICSTTASAFEQLRRQLGDPAGHQAEGDGLQDGVGVLEPLVGGSAETCSLAEAAARRTAVALSSWESASVAEAANSCASSMMTASCSGSTWTPVKASSASRAWLATTMSASLASSRAFSAKQSTRSGHLLPRHSRALTRHLPPGPVVDRERHLVAVTGRRRPRPTRAA